MFEEEKKDVVAQSSANDNSSSKSCESATMCSLLDKSGQEVMITIVSMDLSKLCFQIIFKFGHHHQWPQLQSLNGDASCDVQFCPTRSPT